jgi:hypothetical protein
VFALTDVPAHDELGVGVERGPGPHVTDSEHAFEIVRDILLLAVHQRPNLAKRPSRLRDPNRLAKLIMDIATGQGQDPDMDAGKDAKMVALGQKGGLKCGKASAATLTPEQRSESARRAARARWGDKP